MTIEEIKKLKDEAEASIASTLNELQSKTGMEIDYVNIDDNLFEIGKDDPILGVSIAMRLK